MNNPFNRRLIHTLILTACALISGAQAKGEAYFGYAPLNPDPENTSALGSGKNGYTEAAITLDPQTNPVAEALRGTRIVGVRCYMRTDYRQKRKKTSSINIRQGSLDNDPVKQYVDFTEGWNDIILDEPVEIGDEPIYIGPMVYETSGTPYPFVAAKGPAFPGGFCVTLNKEPWQQYTQRGNLLMQLILDRKPEEMPCAAQAAIADIPIVVAPQSHFSCDMSIHNYSGSPIESVTIKSITDNSGTELYRTIELDTPIAAFDTSTLHVSLETGTIEDKAVGYTVLVSAINGSQDVVSPQTSYSLHVTQDAFLRIPLVEEYTSQKCVNCPFMMYYIDRAMEEFGKPHVYITRHSGFARDRFTTSEDEGLVYLFGSENTFNPAVMYDRTIFEENGTTPVTGASDASTSPYLDALNLAATQPAYARIIVDSKTADGKVSCSVKGKIAKGVDTEGLYICAYLIENKIPRDEQNYQFGIDDAPDDAPDDLAETFSHNGIVRVRFHKQDLGDILTVDPVTREFHVDFGNAEIGNEWNQSNCEAVAFICRINKDDLFDNYVLNAGGTRWNEYVDGGSSVDYMETAVPVSVIVDADRRLRIDGEYLGADVYTVAGQKLSVADPLPQGINIIRITLRDGSSRSVKVAVR